LAFESAYSDIAFVLCFFFFRLRQAGKADQRRRKQSYDFTCRSLLMQRGTEHGVFSGKLQLSFCGLQKFSVRYLYCFIGVFFRWEREQMADTISLPSVRCSRPLICLAFFSNHSFNTVLSFKLR
jgi:hypothetical protein